MECVGFFKVGRRVMRLSGSSPRRPRLPDAVDPRARHEDLTGAGLALTRVGIRVRGPSGQFKGGSVEMLLVRGRQSGQEIFYMSTEASDSVAATLERSTFVPALQGAPFLGADDFLGSAREPLTRRSAPRAGLQPALGRPGQRMDPEGVLRGPLGGKFGAGDFVINCPTVAFSEEEPVIDQVAPARTGRC